MGTGREAGRVYLWALIVHPQLSVTSSPRQVQPVARRPPPDMPLDELVQIPTRLDRRVGERVRHRVEVRKLPQQLLGPSYGKKATEVGRDPSRGP
jgi:hypothetical protein